MNPFLGTTFNMDQPLVVIIVAIIIGVVIAQSAFFLVKAVKHAKKLGIDQKTIRNTIQGTAVFTIVPALSILMGVVVLIGSLGGYALPWLRLSVIGALTYELTSASSVTTALGIDFITNGSEYVTIALVMTLGIIVGLIAVPFVCKPISGKIDQMKAKNNEWTELLVSAMFVGMISAFLGFIFSDVTKGLEGWIPVFVMLIASTVMILMGLLIKLTHWKVLENYAIPVSMIVAMACALPITQAILG